MQPLSLLTRLESRCNAKTRPNLNFKANLDRCISSLSFLSRLATASDGIFSYPCLFCAANMKYVLVSGGKSAHNHFLCAEIHVLQVSSVALEKAL
jgi:hypothetical protein